MVRTLTFFWWLKYQFKSKDKSMQSCHKLFNDLVSLSWDCKPLINCRHVFTFHLGFVHPLPDTAFHQCLPLSSVCCCPVPGGSLLPCYVVLPSSTWSCFIRQKFWTYEIKHLACGCIHTWSTHFGCMFGVWLYIWVKCCLAKAHAYLWRENTHPAWSLPL